MNLCELGSFVDFFARDEISRKTTQHWSTNKAKQSSKKKKKKQAT